MEACELFNLRMFVTRKAQSNLLKRKVTAIILLVYKICTSYALIMQQEKGSKKKIKN